MEMYFSRNRPSTLNCEGLFKNIFPDGREADLPAQPPGDVSREDHGRRAGGPLGLQMIPAPLFRQQRFGISRSLRGQNYYWEMVLFFLYIQLQFYGIPETKTNVSCQF